MCCLHAWNRQGQLILLQLDISDGSRGIKDVQDCSPEQVAGRVIEKNSAISVVLFQLEIEISSGGIKTNLESQPTFNKVAGPTCCIRRICLRMDVKTDPGIKLLSCSEMASPKNPFQNRIKLSFKLSSETNIYNQQILE